MKNIKQQGFSLLELLIVVGIIIVLATVSIVALNGQRANARDAKRISDIRQIRTALELYSSDEGAYPIVPDPIILGVNGKEKLCSKALGSFVAASTQCDAKSSYMVTVPSDPLPTGKYLYTGTATGYDITFSTEKASDLGVAGVYHAHSANIDAAAGNR
jgi:type II secretory pathway pseudopilin PulG